MSNLADAGAGARTSGPIPAPRHSAPTPAVASSLKDHPTVNPTAMLEDAPLDLSNRSDIVIDPFLGSGSTLIAADKTGRVCRGVELDPLYVDVIVRRYEAATGNTAVLVETGETFEVLGARRASEAAPG
jgi:DNA modification methylase